MRDCCGCSGCAQKAWFKFEPSLESKRGRPGNKDGRFGANDFAFERNTLRPPRVGAHGLWRRLSLRMQRQQKIGNLEREEYVRDERLVLDLCGDGRCGPDGVVGRTVCESHRRRPTRMLRNYVQWKMSSSIMRRYPDRTLRGTLLRVMRNYGIAELRSARIVWTAARSILSV